MTFDGSCKAACKLIYDFGVSSVRIADGLPHICGVCVQHTRVAKALQADTMANAAFSRQSIDAVEFRARVRMS